jgi:hypothetical protein
VRLFLLPVVIEAKMLLKTKSVRCDSSKFSCPTLFLIMLNLNGLSDCDGGREWGSAHTKNTTFEVGMSLKTNEADNDNPRSL